LFFRYIFAYIPATTSNPSAKIGAGRGVGATPSQAQRNPADVCGGK
jgi:hypothetical protein